jgi:hypothetical protein
VVQGTLEEFYRIELAISKENCKIRDKSHELHIKNIQVYYANDDI